MIDNARIAGPSGAQSLRSFGVPTVIFVPHFVRNSLPAGPLLSPGPRPAMSGRGLLSDAFFVILNAAKESII